MSERLPMGSERGRALAALCEWADAECRRTREMMAGRPRGAADEAWQHGFEDALRRLEAHARSGLGEGEWPEGANVPLPDGWVSQIARRPGAAVDATNGRSVLTFYERDGWSANTPAGVLWTLFDDYRQCAICAVAEAVRVVERAEATGKPPAGGWS